VPHFLLIDGTNLYLSARERDEEVDGQQPDPCLDAVESVIANCLANGIPFKCYFDSSAKHHFRWWAANAGSAGQDLQQRFLSMCTLDESRLKLADTGEADMFILNDARVLLNDGHEVYVVTRDRFRDRQRRYPELGRADSRGRPERCLSFSTSNVEGKRSLVFPFLPQFGGELQPDVQIPISTHRDITDRIRTKWGARRPPQHQPAPRAETQVIKVPAELSIGDLRIHGSAQIYTVGVRQQDALGGWPVTVGRSDDQDFVVAESFGAVSRRQLEFHCDASTRVVTVVDVGSSNGTWMGGKRLERGVAIPLPAGEGLITMAKSEDPGSLDVHLHFDNDVFSQAGVAHEAGCEAAALPLSAPVLHVRLAGGRRLQYEITSYPFTVGTAVTGDGASLDFPEVMSVSREHLKILRSTGDEGFLVLPLGRNGTSFEGIAREDPFVLPFASEVLLSPRDTRTGSVALWITRN
jgi:pSer/pThr/pTyr-binding forkhead associated (FHA) protein